jgi:hypothetical protein
MKGKLLMIYLFILLSFCVIIWKTRDGFYVMLAYIVLSVLITGVRKILLNKLNS